MTTRTAQTSPLVYARVAGVLYLLITLVAIVAHFYVPSNIVVPGDAAATASNLAASESLFRVGSIGGELVILLSEIVLSVLLYLLLEPVSLLNYLFALQLVSGAGYLSVFDTGQLQALVMLFLDAHSLGFTIGIAFLTVHVFLLGYLIFRSGYLPKVLGILFLVAGMGYLVDSFAQLLSSSYQTTPAVITLAIAVAELAFPFWLLVKGVNVERWKERALLPAPRAERAVASAGAQAPHVAD